MDDYAGSFNDQNKAFTTYKTAKQIMSEGSFNLRKWRTNDKTLAKRIAENENVSVDKDDGTSENEIVKVLGLSWHTDGDYFTFQFDDLIKFAKSLTLTKRNVLRFGGKFYDPLGFLSPFTVRIKMFFSGTLY